MAADILFNAPLIGSSAIVFGAPPDSGVRLVRVAAGMPVLGARVSGHVAALRVSGNVAAGMPGLSCAARIGYDNAVLRGPAAEAGAPWADASPIGGRTAAAFESADRVSAGHRAPWQDAEPVPFGVSAVFHGQGRCYAGHRDAWQDAAPVSSRSSAPWGDMIPLRRGVRAHWQDAVPIGTSRGAPWGDMLPVRVSRDSRWQEAVRALAAVSAEYGPTLPASVSAGARWQDAIQPRPGRSQIPVVPGTEPFVGDPAILFRDRWTGATAILFGAPSTAALISVPIQEVYLTINSATLIRLDTGDEIPVSSASVAIDYESWTWTLSAAAPGRALSQLQRNSNGDPVAVRLTVNGTPLHFLVESISRDRSFASSALRIQGRGFAAELDAPYAPTMSFANAFARTGRQLLDDILTLNGVPIGWSIDKALFTDWNVPAKVFSHSGTYISALNAVAGAIGAYIQPHDTERKLDVLLRYPTPAWAWGDVVPDFELPAAVTSQESIEWVTNPNYDRVFVVGQENGITGQYSRAGSAGTLVAATVTDPLITEAAAARQRGRAVLSEGGQIANVTLRLPVLAETGIIRPGKFVRYVDGSTVRKGLVRGVSADVAMPTIYQTVRVETRV